jgi:cystathionine beta-lyase family protein involved in aluminum resistance
VDPIPFQQEGYSSPIVMAGGTFTSGSSIEFSADGFTKAPYRLYYQPGMYKEQSIVLAEKLFNDYRFRL